MNARALALALALACLPAGSCACLGTSTVPPPDGGPPLPPPQQTPAVQWKGAPLPVRVAKSAVLRARGFAGPARLAGEDALLRVWPEPLYVAIGNRGYQVHSELAFLDAEGKMVHRAELGPDTTTEERHRTWVKSPVRVQYVLEVGVGRLAALGLGEGSVLTIAPAVAQGAAAQPPPIPDLQRTTLTVGGVAVVAEVARTAAQRRMGLMFRNGLPENHGMLFVYPTSRNLGFWMKNCCMEIDVAYINAAGRIVTIRAMAPGWHTPNDADLPSYPATGPTPYALEMAGGWYAEHGVKEGDVVTLPPDIDELRSLAED